MQDLPEEFPILPEDNKDTQEEGIAHSVPSNRIPSQNAAVIQDVIVIETDSDSHESKEREEKKEDEGEEGEAEEQDEDNGEVLFCLSKYFQHRCVIRAK